MCGADIPPEDRRYVKYYPELDPALLCYDVLDSRRERRRTERPKQNTLVNNEALLLIMAI